MRLQRFAHAVVEGQDSGGRSIRVEGTGYFSRCLQHETNHLDGQVYVDRLEGDVRRRAMREIRAATWSRQPTPPSCAAGTARRTDREAPSSLRRRERDRLTSPRRCFWRRLGRVGRRGGGGGAVASVSSAASRARAIARLRSCERRSEARTVRTPSTRLVMLEVRLERSALTLIQLV